jgi:xanthine/CO dehydrogenase XdhC/CoxF family maturation factor
VSQRTQIPETLTVLLRRLDDVPDVAAITPHFSKIYVEGEGLRVLFGAEATIRRARPIIVAEVDWKFLFRGEGKPSEQVLFDWLAGLCPGGYRMFNFFGEPVTAFDWDAWNVVMLLHDHPETAAVLRTVVDAGQRFFALTGDWDPMKRYRDAAAAAGAAGTP